MVNILQIYNPINDQSNVGHPDHQETIMTTQCWVKPCQFRAIGVNQYQSESIIVHMVQLVLSRANKGQAGPIEANQGQITVKLSLFKANQYTFELIRVIFCLWYNQDTSVPICFKSSLIMAMSRRRRRSASSAPSTPGPLLLGKGSHPEGEKNPHTRDTEYLDVRGTNTKKIQKS